MNSLKRYLFAALVCGVLLPAAASAHTRIYVKIAPPRPRPVKVVVKPHRVGMVFVPGHWKWTGRRYVWVSGRWVKARKHSVYVPGHWQHSRRGWYWVPGHWKRI